MAKLVAKYADTVKEFDLSKNSFSIGRSPENDLCLHDNLLSRRHTSIRFEDNSHVVHDLGSTNGTFVNEQRITRHVLRHGDVVRIGDATLTYHHADGATSKAASVQTAVAGKEDIAPITHMAATRDVVRHIEDIAEPLSINADLRGVSSLGQISRSIAVQKGQKETAMFFILYQICKAVSSVVTLQEILETSIKLAFDVINAERGGIILFDEKGAPRKGGVGYERRRGYVPIDDIAPSQTIVGRVVRERVSLISHDALTDAGTREAYSIVNLSIRSVLSVPLWEEDRVYGAIYLDNRASTYAFTQGDLELLTAIANLVAIRIRQENLNDKLRREEVTRAALARFHSPDVVEFIVKSGGVMSDEMVTRDVTILFVDIADSTTIAERIGPVEVSRLLDTFYEMASNAIFEQRGGVNNYIGDAVMAIFNAPLDVPDHALAAVKAAVRLIKDVRQHNAASPDRVFNVRVGINTGTAMAGQVGHKDRMAYTVLGDPVNVAERLTRNPETNKIVIGPDTYEKVKGVFECRDLGPLQLKGKHATVHCYEVIVP